MGYVINMSIDSDSALYCYDTYADPPHQVLNKHLYIMFALFIFLKNPLSQDLQDFINILGAKSLITQCVLWTEIKMTPN